MGNEAVSDSDLLGAIESWWKCVRLLESELDETLETKLHYRGPYDLLGIYGHRELLERYLAGRDSAATDAADEFLLSFSERLERDWTADLGVGDSRGNGWWWDCVPYRGPLRKELDERMERVQNRINNKPNG